MKTWSCENKNCKISARAFLHGLLCLFAHSYKLCENCKKIYRTKSARAFSLSRVKISTNENYPLYYSLVIMLIIIYTCTPPFQTRVGGVTAADSGSLLCHGSVSLAGDHLSHSIPSSRPHLVLLRWVSEYLPPNQLAILYTYLGACARASEVYGALLTSVYLFSESNLFEL